MSESATTEHPAEKKDRSHYLYVAVIAAVVPTGWPADGRPPGTHDG